jgi:hypothetical protein
MLRMRNISTVSNVPTGDFAPVARSRGMPWRLPAGRIPPCMVNQRP